jgi:hypothetical protein
MKHIKSFFGPVLVTIIICVLTLPTTIYAQTEKAATGTEGAGAGNVDAAAGVAEGAGEAAGSGATAGVEAGTIAAGAAAAAAVAAGAAALTSSGDGSPSIATTAHH